MISSLFNYQILPESFLSAKVSYLLPTPAPPLGLPSVFGKVSSANASQTSVLLEPARLTFWSPSLQNIASLNPCPDILIDAVGLQWSLGTISQTWFWSGHTDKHGAS